ncbi:phytoene desaturase family protein [Nocardia sp. NPDC006044]|uniref:phytoene desaturase family protein n=1 Tax=Nocardia sp. NPDC006044 TaxID=3364306 RepID=UPI0036CE3ED5
MSGEPDVLVVGAGISGLAAAIALQAAGRQVRVCERRDTVGGLCGSRELDGFEFTVACNDFGSAFARTMSDLGVDIAFTEPQSLFCTERARYRFPIGLRTIRPFIPLAADLFRFLRAVHTVGDKPIFVADILDRHVRSRDFADFIGTFCWAFATPPRHFRADMFAALFSKKLAYGYDRPVTPVGGPQVLVDRMAQRLVELGGTIDLRTPVTQVSEGPGTKTVLAGGQVTSARYVVSSEARLDLYPPTAIPGLAAGVLHLATAKDAPFPPGVHTIAHIPPNVPRLLDTLDQGEQPAAPLFSIFPCDLPGERDYRSFNAYVLFPRGITEFGPAERDQLERYILAQVETIAPGFTRKIRYRRLISPAQFQRLHGLSSVAIPAVLPPNFTKPDGYDHDRDIYYVGNSVQPTCEHAGSALESALHAAAAINSREQPHREWTKYSSRTQSIR